MSHFPACAQACFFSSNFQRGLSEAQNGYGFGMIPGYGPQGPVTGTLQAWHQVVALLASLPQRLSLKDACHGDLA